MNILVGIATINRPAMLREMLRHLESQLRRPDEVIICANKPADVDGIAEAVPGVTVIFAEASASSQRNAILRAAEEADVVLFLDDDFFPQVDFLVALERHMAATPDTVVVSGEVIADGITGPGISLEACAQLLQADWDKHGHATAADKASPVFSGYGCNMAVRMSAIRRGNIYFDENLPLYSWQEDTDLSRRLSVFGNVLRLSSARGVHLGVKAGRSSGVRLGYSQVANPIYLVRKRQGYPLTWALRHILRNIGKNVVGSFRPEPYIDRRGRLRGNVIALKECLLGRMSPRRVVNL